MKWEWVGEGNAGHTCITGEIGIFYSCLPDRMLILKGQYCHKGKGVGFGWQIVDTMLLKNSCKYCESRML